MKSPSLIAGVSLIVVAHAGAAAAATAFVAPSDKAPTGEAVRYIADAGETNTVTVVGSESGDDLEITDGGATISAGPGCTSLAPNKVACDYVEAFDVELGDGNDRLDLSVWSTGSVLRGGEGNDRILGGGGIGFAEHLVGGRGNDLLSGGGGHDILNGGPGADTFSGGTTFDCGPDICTFDLDVVTYARRVNGVKADADGVRDDGERGEGDLIRADIEGLVGGQGDDVLGGATTNFSGHRHRPPYLVGLRLVGRRGNDVLRCVRALADPVTLDEQLVLRGNGRADRMLGNRGNDRLIGGPGLDKMAGRRGNDLLRGGSGRDRLSGGAGRDLLLARDGRADALDGGSWMDSARVDRGLDFVRRIETILP